MKEQKARKIKEELEGLHNGPANLRPRIPRQRSIQLLYRPTRWVLQRRWLMHPRRGILLSWIRAIRMRLTFVGKSDLKLAWLLLTLVPS